MISELTKRLANRTLTMLKAEDEVSSDISRDARPFICFPSDTPGQAQIVTRGYFIEWALRAQH